MAADYDEMGGRVERISTAKKGEMASISGVEGVSTKGRVVSF